MKNHVSLYIARKLSLSADGRRWSPSVTLSVIAVALSLSVMLAAVCIVTGFKKEITSGVIGFNSHITILPHSDASRPVITLTPTLKNLLDDKPYIADYSLETSMPAVFKTPEQFKGIYIRGIDNMTDSVFLASKLVKGRMPSFSGNHAEVLLSQKTALDLGIVPGDTLDTFFMGGDVTMRLYVVAGTYLSHFEYDTNYAYLPLKTANEVVALSQGEGTDIKINTINLEQSDVYTADLINSLEQGYAENELYSRYNVVSTVRAAAGYFSWLSLLDTNVIVILILMTAVAAITLISAMLIMIGEKARIIGILRALGTAQRSIRSIFVILACRVCILGLILGNAITLTFLILEEKYHFVHLDPEAYYIDFMPVTINPWFVIILNIGVVAAVFLLLLIPARSASRIAPAEAMIRN